jgi:hypothetical protein
MPIAKVKNPSTPALENLMKDQILAFVIRNGLQNLFQTGFRSAPGTTTALLNVTADCRRVFERRLVTG